MKVYNTLTRKKEEFKPIKPKTVSIYVCGPTIYDYGHIGHGRSAVNFDIIRRYFMYKNFKINFVFNYTDIDDKIIERANRENTTTKKLTEKFEKIYDQDYEKLNVLPPTHKPKPTEEMTSIINLIKEIEKKGFSYMLDDGLYFDTSAFKNYGKLSHQIIKELQAGVRIKADEKKKNFQDFVLWKLSKSGEPSWPSPWGTGRPGWHIECSAMSSKYLGQPFDIHGGGQDLIFPHHENEIAQSESVNKKKFANYWLHNGFVEVNKEKMSKSLGNFKTMREIFEQYDPMVVRYMILSAHYKAPIDFSKDNLEQAKNSLNRIQEFVLNAKESKKEIDKELLESTKEDFIEYMDNDFDTPKALAVIFNFIRESNKQGNGKNAYDLIIDLDKILGLNLDKLKKDKIPEKVKEMVKQREKARNDKDWIKADKLRDAIKELGFIIEDSEKGQKIKKI
ncbi:cysteine--tRNA ligase [Candidatus Woesearchaeota archaeon]|nr:cysteine--tRNA ligase [Candidatus Woesearchaeota archaeon]